MDISFSLRDFSRTLKKYWWIPAALLVIGFTISCIRLSGQEPSYTATADFIVGTELETKPTASDYASTHSLVFTCQSLVTTDAVLNDSIARAGLSMTASQLVPFVDVKVPNNGDYVIVQVTSRGERNAVNLANAIVDAASDRVKSLSSTIPAKITQIDRAVPPDKAPAKNYAKAGLFGGVAGAAAAFLLLIIASSVSSGARSEEVITRAVGFPMLGTIPQNEKSKAKALRLLAAAIHTRISSHSIITFAASKNAGKTETASAALLSAFALAEAGFRPLLLEYDESAKAFPGDYQDAGPLIRRDEKNALDVISACEIPDIKRASELLGKLRGTYDYIMIAPFEEGTDGIRAAVLGDCSIQLNRYGKTRLSDASELSKELLRCGIKPAGYVLLNTPE